MKRAQRRRAWLAALVVAALAMPAVARAAEIQEGADTDTGADEIGAAPEVEVAPESGGALEPESAPEPEASPQREGAPEPGAAPESEAAPASEAATPAAPPGAAPPSFLDERGEPVRAAFEALVAEIESARGLAFVRRPELVSVSADSPELGVLAAQAREREPFGSNAAPEPPADLPALEVDLERARVLVSGPPDRFALGLALARILDAQHYPRLAAAAPGVRGDPGIALRSLLRASASATASRSWRPRSESPPALGELDLLRPARIEGRIGGVRQFAAGPAWIVAAVFLATRDDREEALRAPPLSTKQLLSPPAYEASDRPLRLTGPAPQVPGCELRSDESLGVLALLVALAAWKGDRLLRYECEDGAAPWIYAARLAGADEAPAFAAALDALLPPELARPFGSARSGTRVVAWSGLPGAPIRDFADGLEEIELRDLAQLAP
jgi:hypothetical protein